MATRNQQQMQHSRQQQRQHRAGGGARAAVKAQMAARREKQERERAVREEELAWLAEYDQRREERDSLVETVHRDDNVSAEERKAAAVRLKQIDPGWNSGTEASTSNTIHRQAYSIRKQYFRWDQQAYQWVEKRSSKRLGESSSNQGGGSSGGDSRSGGNSGDDSSSSNGSREAAQVDSGSSGSSDDELCTNRTTTRRMYNCAGCCYVPKELRGRT